MSSKTISPSQSISEPKYCHLLPCSIAYDGPAPIQMYFEGPLLTMDALEDDHHTPKQSNNKTTNHDNNLNHQSEKLRNRIYMTQFRGRQLMAIASTDNTTVQGRIVSLDGSHKSSWKKFDRILEWHHTSSSRTIPLKKSRIKTALQWCQLASSLHDPLPVKDDET
jgi:hypothetical protein